MSPETAARCVEAAAAALELRIAKEHLPGVVRYFGLAAEMAALVNAEPLTPEDESGAVFRPVPPRGPAA